jgi:hypothetical protein
MPRSKFPLLSFPLITEIGQLTGPDVSCQHATTQILPAGYDLVSLAIDLAYAGYYTAAYFWL